MLLLLPMNLEMEGLLLRELNLICSVMRHMTRVQFLLLLLMLFQKKEFTIMLIVITHTVTHSQVTLDTLGDS